ncbi:MAG TPA: phage holin family protein [Longimicrobiales bacterium]
MATQQRIEPRDRTDGRLIHVEEETHLRDLLKQLAADGSDLLRGEIALAKLEMRDMARSVALDSARVAAALGVALLGGLVLVAAAVIGLGWLLDGRFGLAALIIGGVLLLAGGLLARSGIEGLRNMPRKPEESVRSVRRDGEWARRELKEFRQEIRS